MTIVSLDRLLRGGRFVGSRGSKSRLGEFARICRRRRSCDSFPNRPYGQRMLSCPRGNEGMSQEALANSSMFTSGQNDQIRAAIERGLALAESFQDSARQVRLLAGLNTFLLRLGDIRGALAAAEQIGVIARAASYPT